MKIAYTVATANYLAFSKALANSFIEKNPDYKFVICLIDKVQNRFDLTSFPNIEIVEVEKLGMPFFGKMVDIYNIFELSCALKPFFAVYLFREMDASSIIYLDSDILVYNSFSEIDKLLSEYNIILTPHSFSPFMDEFFPDESTFSNHGIFNAGFFALRESFETYRFLDWWMKKLRNECKVDLCRGLFVDQLWLNLALVYFEGVYILKNPGYNVAYFNLHERIVNIKDGVFYVNKIFPLVFYHYSGFDIEKPMYISKYQNRHSINQRDDIKPLLNKYINNVFECGYHKFKQLKCFYSSKEPIEENFTKKQSKSFNSLDNNESETELIASFNFGNRSERDKVMLNERDIPQVKYNFIGNPFLELSGKGYSDYLAQIIDLDSDKIFFELMIKPNNWIRGNRSYHTNWLLVVKEDNKIIFRHKFNLEGKKVHISLPNSSLSNTLAWFPYIEKFQKLHKCDVVISSYWNELFSPCYSQYSFVKHGETVKDIYAMYEIDIYPGNFNKNKNDYRTIPLQKIATDYLGLEYEEQKPEIFIPDKNRNIKDKYICISEYSTVKAKKWNYPGGWQEVVNYLNDKGYKVVVISKEKTLLKNVIDKTGDIPIEDRIIDLKYAEFFIGLSSGISWLSWSVGTPVIMVSGFTSPWYEFKSNIIRVYNSQVCNSCFNSQKFNFDMGDPDFCPEKQDFICTREIKPEKIFEAIEVWKSDE